MSLNTTCPINELSQGGKNSLTFVIPVDTSGLDLLSGDVFFLKVLTLEPMPQGALSCVSISSDDNFHCSVDRKHTCQSM